MAYNIYIKCRQCIARESSEYECYICKNKINTKPKFSVGCGTKDVRFKTWFFCCYEHYIEFIKEYQREDELQYCVNTSTSSLQ